MPPNWLLLHSPQTCAPSQPRHPSCTLPWPPTFRFHRLAVQHNPDARARPRAPPPAPCPAPTLPVPIPTTDLRSNTTQTEDPSQTTTFTYSKTLGLGLCSSDPIPSPDTIQYPFEQLGVYAHTFEVQPSNASGTDPVLPTPRHGHAVAYANDPLLEPAWGVGGVLILFGGEWCVFWDRRGGAQE